MSKVAVTLIKSASGRLPKHKATLKGLGLSKIGQTVMMEDTDCLRGMLRQVCYLVRVEPYKS